jgi:phage repressor protein C with HTH and peptisase S24 domain
LDGTAVSNLTGYHAYYATTSPITGDNSQILTVEGETTSVALTDLPVGTYYVAVSAVYAGGNESDLTEEIEVAVQ